MIQVKIFEHDNGSAANQYCNKWLYDNREALSRCKVEIKLHGDMSGTAGWPCSIMLIISKLDPSDKKWDFDTTGPTDGDFCLHPCV